jgi:ribosomal subunit interface protein
VEVVVKGRHCEVSERFRRHAEEKLAKLEKYDDRVIRVDVEVAQERNPRLSAQSCRVELTLRSKGPVIRAEAAAEDKLAALDQAMERLQARVRKAADRRRVHHGLRTPPSIAEALPEERLAGSDGEARPGDGELPGEHMEGPLAVTGDGPLVVREKTHQAVPMPLDQALYEMELVGHDFYLFLDQDTAQPAVVYRRRGYDYGVIRLET